MSFDFYVASAYALVQRGLTVIPPLLLRWDICVEKLSILDWDISGLHTGANNLGSGSQNLCLSCSTAARWGLPPSCWVQGPNPAQSWGVKRFSKFVAPFCCTFSGRIGSDAEQKARRRDEDILCPSLPVKLNWSLPAPLKIVILDKRLCNNLRNVWEDLVLILYKPSLTSGSLKSNLAELTRAVNMEPLDSGNRENWLTNLQYFVFF